MILYDFWSEDFRCSFAVGGWGVLSFACFKQWKIWYLKCVFCLKVDSWCLRTFRGWMLWALCQWYDLSLFLWHMCWEKNKINYIYVFFLVASKTGSSVVFSQFSEAVVHLVCRVSFELIPVQTAEGMHSMITSDDTWVEEILDTCSRTHISQLIGIWKIFVTLIFRVDTFFFLCFSTSSQSLLKVIVVTFYHHKSKNWENICGIISQSTSTNLRSNYSDLTRPHPKW